MNIQNKTLALAALSLAFAATPSFGMLPFGFGAQFNRMPPFLRNEERIMRQSCDRIQKNLADLKGIIPDMKKIIGKKINGKKTYAFCEFDDFQGLDTLSASRNFLGKKKIELEIQELKDFWAKIQIFEREEKLFNKELEEVLESFKQVRRAMNAGELGDIRYEIPLLMVTRLRQTYAMIDSRRKRLKELKNQQDKIYPAYFSKEERKLIPHFAPFAPLWT